MPRDINAPTRLLEREGSLSFYVAIEEGPLLRELRSAHALNEAALRHPRVEEIARALIERSHELQSPLIWPVGVAADRLAGSAVVVSGGNLRVRGWTDDLVGETVLLLVVVETTPLRLAETAAHARTLGATQVHAAMVEVRNTRLAGLNDVIDSQVLLSPNPRLEALAG